VQGGTRRRSGPYTSKELGRLLEYTPEEWCEDTLVHNTNNAVLKVLSPTGGGTKSEEWRPSEDPSHWNYWEREALAYEQGVTSAYSVAGISGPGLLSLNRRPNGEISLWLRDAQSEDGSVPGTRWSTEDYRRFAYGLGFAQGRIAATGAATNYPWLTRRFLRDYVLSKQADRSVLYSDEAWRHPLVRDNFPDGLRQELIQLHEERERFFSLMERLPRTLCHLDVWPNNLFAGRDGTFTLIDWSFVGEGALGEDIGNLVPDSVFDLFVPARNLASLDREVFGGYLSGLREAGWEGDERTVRLGMCASAVKYEWLGPLMLQRASNARQLDYGGRETVDADLLYAERRIALTFLASWAEEARALAEELGLAC
jgi:hypothetical protein